MSSEKGKYYNFIVSEIKDFKHIYKDVVYNGILETLKNRNVDLEEFDFSFEWAIADVFGGGCEVEWE